MSDETENLTSMEQGHRDLANAIEMLEEALPNIEQPIGVFICLYDLYADLEDMSQAGACLMEAARRVSLGQQKELTHSLYGLLELFAQVNSEAQEIYERLGQAVSGEEDVLMKNAQQIEQRKIYKYDLIPELLLAQHLMRARQLSEAEYHIVLRDLCAISADPPTGPSTVLDALHQRDLPHEKQVIEFLSHDSSIPYIDLSLVSPNPDVLQTLHLEFVNVRGACVFGTLAGEKLIAVQNPYNLQLRDDISLLVKNECHYFICDALGYRKMLQSLPKQVSPSESVPQ